MASSDLEGAASWYWDSVLFDFDMYISKIPEEEFGPGNASFLSSFYLLQELNREPLESSIDIAARLYVA